MGKKHTKAGRIFGIVNGMPDMGKTTFIQQYLIPKISQKRPVIILDPVGEYEGNRFDDFSHFENAVYDLKKYPPGVNVIKFDQQIIAKKLIHFVRHNETPAALIFEEAHMLWDGSILDKVTREKLNQICFMGAHYGFTVILSTQKPKSLSTTCRSAANFIVSFKQTEPASLDYLRKKGGAPKETGKKIASLKEYQFYSIGTKPKGFEEIKINQINQLEL